MVRVPSRLMLASAVAVAVIAFATVPVTATHNPSPASPVYDQLEPVCKTVSENKPNGGDDNGPSAPPHSGWDEFMDHSECYQMRNNLQRDHYSPDVLGSWQECQKVAGRNNCVGWHKSACDVALWLGGGVVNLCLGMILPDE